jgi:hypothetical protein
LRSWRRRPPWAPSCFRVRSRPAEVTDVGVLCFVACCLVLCSLLCCQCRLLEPLRSVHASLHMPLCRPSWSDARCQVSSIPLRAARAAFQCLSNNVMRCSLQLLVTPSVTVFVAAPRPCEHDCKACQRGAHALTSVSVAADDATTHNSKRECGASARQRTLSINQFVFPEAATAMLTCGTCTSTAPAMPLSLLLHCVAICVCEGWRAPPCVLRLHTLFKQQDVLTR